MNTREIAREYRKSQWTQRLITQKASGQSIREWCERNGVKRNQFFYWQRRLRETAVERIAAQKNTPSMIPGGWALCTTEAEPPKSKVKGITIEIGNSRVLAEPGFEPELLEKVCRVLSSIY